MDQYHMFWHIPVGNERGYRVTDDYDEVIEMQRKSELNEADGYSNVRSLVVILGRKLAFEPAEIVKTWRIKE